MLHINLDRFDTYLPESIRYLRDKSITNNLFFKHYGRSFDWDNPQTFSEKIQVFKISQTAEKYTQYVDKWEVRTYVRKTIGEKYLIKSYGCFDTVEEIDLKKLPNSFVIKPTHGSGWIITCKDKNTFDWENEKVKLQDWLHTNFYFRSRERMYRTIKPRIIVEEYLLQNNGAPIDFKIFCFDGKPTYINVVTGRFTENKKQYMYDLDWNLLYIGHKKGHEENDTFAKPNNLQQLLDIAQKLATPFPHVRVDLYSIENNIYFSELTFSDSSGFYKYLVGKWDVQFGKNFNLRS